MLNDLEIKKIKDLIEELVEEQPYLELQQPILLVEDVIKILKKGQFDQLEQEHITRYLKVESSDLQLRIMELGYRTDTGGLYERLWEVGELIRRVEEETCWTI